MTAKEKFSVGLVQMACSADPKANLDKAVARVEEAAGKGAAIVCLPELFSSRYFFAVLPWIGLAFALPASRLVRAGRARNATLLVFIAALFVNETLFFLLRVIPFYRRTS